MKYKAEVEQLLKDLFFDPVILDEEDWPEWKELFFAHTGTSIEELSRHIETGVRNGKSVEEQVALVKQIIGAYNERKLNP